MVTYEKFLDYHHKNPKVYIAFVRFTFQAIHSGRKYFGAKQIWERLRWYSQIDTNGDDYKINNNYTSFYARMFEENNPEYIGFFRKRRSIADQKGFDYAKG